MHVISRKALTSFSARYKDADLPLRAWFTIFKKAEFQSFASVKKVWNSVDKVEKFTVFDIGGNKYRLIAIIHYQRRKIFIRAVLTHKEYDSGHWKRQ